MHVQLYKHTPCVFVCCICYIGKKVLAQKYVTMFYFKYSMFTFYTVGLYQENVCVCVCVRACLRACVCACVCVCNRIRWKRVVSVQLT